jgi:hypothetical protein
VCVFAVCRSAGDEQWYLSMLQGTQQVAQWVGAHVHAFVLDSERYT